LLEICEIYPSLDLNSEENPERQSPSMWFFFHPREKIGFPIWIRNGL
jgi:hypothetical protein